MEEIVVIACVCTAKCDRIFEVGRQSRVGALEVQQLSQSVSYSKT